MRSPDLVGCVSDRDYCRVNVRAIAHLVETVLKVNRRLRETLKREARSYFPEGRSSYRLRETLKREARS
ncbi:hypothetical protein PQG02_28615 [Nostoc sp. UHCC 0926]|uniref:hypothetical protein n=1 Tax=unclassified Nostoc TaxID=2593658 RepID=UPI0023611174|nr:hypothetical protein [Nostoc sp. UHCC 0926]WDD32568.1 hypothetical protein PQG02_28615 [Nostoc sp. UHCC 0926]